MPRAFTPDDVVQSVPDTGTNVPSVDPTLAATTEGHGGVLILAALSPLTAPENWHFAAQAGTATYGDSLVAVMVRPDLPAGETTWPFTSKAGTNIAWAWIIEEWTNLSFAPVLGESDSGMLVSPSTAATGATGGWDAAEYVVGIAALAVVGSAGATSGWSAVTWSDGFVEDAASPLSVGNGQGSVGGDIRLHVARRYGTAGETGGWSTTATFTNGAQTNKTAYACLAVFRAEHYDTDA